MVHSKVMVADDRFLRVGSANLSNRSMGLVVDEIVDIVEDTLDIQVGSDRPGVLGQIATTLGRLGANILEVDHKRLFLDVPAKGARLDVTVETRDGAHAQDILAAFEADGFAPVRIDTGDAME